MQLADSAFPVGGFVHSGGLEAALQQGHYRGEQGLARFASDALWQAGTGSLIYVGAANDEPARLSGLDQDCDLFLSNPVANRASRAQGRAFVSTCERAFDNEGVRALAARTRTAELCAHQAPIFGATLAALGLGRVAAQRMHLYSVLRGLVSAAVRLGVVGPYRGQGLQRELEPVLDAVLERCAGLGVADVAQTAPLIEILQSNHDRLYSRLFQS